MLIGLVVAAVTFAMLWLVQYTKLKKSETDNTSLKLRVQELSGYEKYQGLADVEFEIAKLRNQQRLEAELIHARAKEELASGISEAERIKQAAQSDAKTIRSRAEEYASNIQASSVKSLKQAESEAEQKILAAEVEARRIAGSAFEAMKKAETFEKTASAMKNIIEGYGDRYLMPTTSLLDQLAEDFSHTDAGVSLKTARAKTKVLIKDGQAADCLYVEAHRRKTAIEFVLDAFNGKVDSILSAVKDDNAGTLKKKIEDSFQTVNHNGTAFRDARITEAYLAARLDELKWACTAQALKEQEREEQRAIREQMREEEKAAREIEKALKDAQKEEETISKSIDKVRKDLLNANEEQKLKYEAKLAELQSRLTEAEENGRRAVSMAEQTRRGHVYVISNVGSFGEKVLKIGMTRRLDPMDRVYELGDASVPFEFDVHAMIFSEDAPKLEKELHARFSAEQVNKINPRKEFFSVGVARLRAEVETMGIQAHWTLTAEAKEYRETLAISSKTKAVA